MRAVAGGLHHAAETAAHDDGAGPGQALADLSRARQRAITGAGGADDREYGAPATGQRSSRSRSAPTPSQTSVKRVVSGERPKRITSGAR